MRYFASGKLLLFGEYLVLRGARSIAMPLRFGQTLTVSHHESETLIWEAFEKGKRWIKIVFTPSLEVIYTDDNASAEMVQAVRKLMLLIQQNNRELEIKNRHLRFDIDFERSFGFGSSSTLLSLLGQWSGVNPYLLLEESFRGSGFDIAAATASSPIIYKTDGTTANAGRMVVPVNLQPEVTSHLLFIYTGKKQNSQREVANFNSLDITAQQIDYMDTIVNEVVRCNNVESFEKLVRESEDFLSAILGVAAVKVSNFPDYPYAIKSLGAWGGDFIMATFRNLAEAKEYFKKKGLSPIFSYEQLIKHG